MDAWIYSRGGPPGHLNALSILDTISWHFGKEGFSHHLIREACPLDHVMRATNMHVWYTKRLQTKKEKNSGARN